MKSLIALILFLACSPLVGQTPTYDDITFDEEEQKAPYKPLAKKYILLKSKKGTNGMPKVPEADQIKSAEIIEIVLVFTETTEDEAIAREDNNRERWENLIVTYPEFFQFNTSYKNICQCSIGGDAENLKPSQGFYIYYKLPTPKAETPVAVKEEKKVVAETPKAETKEVKETKKVEEPVKEKKEVVKEEKKEEKVVQKVEEKEEDLNAVTEGPAQTSSIDLSNAPQKKPGYSKPKRSKNPKACRPPFYGFGEEDINNFFRDNITLSKKQRRSVKGDVAILKLTLNFDGSIKKAMVNGANTEFNELISVAIKKMDNWNPAVKGGLTVKSEVKLMLKYDKAFKGIKPIETVITPRPAPKCLECKSDSEIFGD